MSKRHAAARRTTANCPPRTNPPRGPAGLAGPRHLSALMGLLTPPSLDPIVDADMPDGRCTMPPADVARTIAGATAVLGRLGQRDMLDGPVLRPLADAAARGRGVSLPHEHSKALWRFCDAFGDDEPLLRGAARGLRVLVG